MIKAILLMGGEGLRFGRQTPKQFALLSGKPIYLHTLEALEKSGLFDDIILVCHHDYVSQIEGHVVSGGRTRQESSYLGLLACGNKTDIVLIHDAVRPFVTPTILKANIEGAETYGAIDTCIPSTDTLVHGTNTIHSIPLRSEYQRGQTPQTFRYPLIKKAHETSSRKEATDDCQLVLESGHPVHIVPGDEYNIKITTELDLFLAEQILRLRPETPLPSLSLTGKRFIITGGSGGIGSALAKALKEAGATPLILSRSHHVDLSSFKEAEAAFQNIGPVDGLINCIGFLKTGVLQSLTLNDIDTMISANLTSSIYACRLAEIIPGGHIVNVASSSYSRGRHGSSIYSSTKAAIVNFTQALSEERPDLHVNAIAPGRTNTEMRRINFPLDLKEELLSPEEVANGIISLLRSCQTGILLPLSKT